MPLEIAPDPPPGEREAVVQALASLEDGSDGAARGAWWRDGVAEALREAGAEPPPAS